MNEVLEKETGTPPDTTTFPDDLNAKVGATLRCEITDAEDTFGVDVRVTAVKGDDVNFHIQVDAAPQATS